MSLSLSAMECCAKLENFLSEKELSIIPESAIQKINEQFTNINQRISELKNENSELNVVLESDQFKFEKEISASRQQLQESTESCAKLKSQVAELEENLSSVQKQWRDLQKVHDSSTLQLQAAKRENDLLNLEKVNLTEQLEKRRNEIDKLNDDLKNLFDQVTSSNEAKFEAIAVSEEAKLRESNLQHQVNRLEQEKELLNRQISDLHAELSQKNNEIHVLKREKSNNSLELKTLLEDRADKIQMISKKLDWYKEILEEKDTRIESLAERIRQLNESHCKAEEQFNLELSAQTKLIDLHKKASEDNQKRVEELMSAFEEAQKLLRESNESCDEMEKHCQDVENKCNAQIEEMKAEVLKLREDLKRARDTANGMSQDAVEKIFPVAAATSKVLHSGMTLTELYVEHIRLQDELQQQKNENANLKRELSQIITEIEEKTPVINQKMQEHEKLTETISCLKSQLANALSDYEKILEERNEAKRKYNLTGRENARLKTQVVDLSRQVQVLLKEVEEARGGSIKRHCDMDIPEVEVSSSDDITAAKVIDRHLVTFRDIEEIQKKNQQLLVVIRDLSQQHEEMEKKKSEEITSKFESEIEALSTQLSDLQKKRSKQSELLETIIRQRDMYRVLLTNQGFSESLLGHSDGSTPGSKTPFSPDPQLKEAKSALNQLQTEFDVYKREKAETEKVLNELVDKMRNEASDLRFQNAKLASQCEYSEERVKILQSNLDTYKKECSSFKEKNRQISSMLVQHQQTINNLRQDLMIAQEKIAKSDVTIDNLKAERDLLKSVEIRLLGEKESVIREQKHQSRVMANLQAVQNNLERIEAETKRNLQFQVEKYEKESSILKTKLENANEDYRSAVNVWEKQKKELQSKIDAEVERNRKIHDDLVHAYSQVHALKQELINTKSQLASDKPASDSPVKTPSKVSPNAQAISDVKTLKDQLNDTQSKLKALQDKLNLTTKSSEQYLSMCKELEQRVKEQDDINKQLKESMDKAISSKKEAHLSLENTLEDLEKRNRELIEENMKLTQDYNNQVNELQKKLNESLKTVEELKSQTEVAKNTADKARQDCQNQAKLMEEVQDKYEREMMLHAQDIKSLSELKEEHQKCSLKIEKLSEATKVAEQNLTDSRESWARQEQTMRSEAEALKTKVVDMEACIHNLHHQLELMGTQMAALQSKNWEDTPYSSIQSDLKDTQHLLQVIQFIKKEKEIASTQHEMVQSENVRLNLKLEQLTNELNSTKAELSDVMNNMQAKAASDAQHSDLLKKIEMMNLLSESNNLLRMERDSIAETKVKLETQVQELQDKLQPMCEKEKELSQHIDMVSAENNALRLEVKSWQSRTNQLLEQSHRIGPQEYKNMLRELEELKSQKTRLADELQRKQTEVSQLSSNLAAVRKELENSKNEVREKLQEVVKMSEDAAEHQRTLLQIKKIGRKYKTQYDEVKLSYDELEARHKALQAETKANDALNHEQIIQDMQQKLDESKTIIQDLKEQIDKQKESTDKALKQVETVQSKAIEKEDKAKKLISALRQRFSQLSGQKDALSEEKNKLNKVVEEYKNKVSTLTSSQEEKEQMKSQTEAKIVQLEKDLKKANDLRITERDYYQKQYDELMLKVSQQKQILKPPIVGLGERTSASGSEPLTANIKPLTSPSTSGTNPTLRHSPHPHAASSSSRPTPTASIRPMAIGTASPAPSQTRMATVWPTTATPIAEEVSVPTTVPHAAVQPTPATATVAPTTMAVTVSPVVSEVSATSAGQEAPVAVPIPSAAVAGSVVAPATALVPPRIEASDLTEPVAVDSPAPMTSVIVSPPATQTQVVTPTVKRPREESPNAPDGQDGSVKRIRMISEGSQTSQQHQNTSVVTPTNIAVVPAAQIVTRLQSQTPPLSEPKPSTSVQVEEKEAAELEVEPSQPTKADEELISTPAEVADAEILEEDKEQNIDWEPQDLKIDDEFEGMEEEAIAEGEEEVEQMQGVDVRSPIDEDMADEQLDDAEEMLDQPTATADADILDATTSDIQMDADSSSLQNAPSEQCMAPPAFPPTPEISPSVAPAAEAAAPTPPSLSAPRTILPPSYAGPPRLERQTPVNRQHLTPFTIPGQGSNFEEGDDGIVPSTPTLYIPRRADGFAEAVSSPQVPPVRFLFTSSDNSPTQQGLSQLASQGALGVDDTRMDLSQFDEGGRTVPSTPIQVSPPAEATVPDVAGSTLETEARSSTSEMVIPIIKVHPAEESSEEPIEFEKSESAEATSDVIKTDEVKEEKSIEISAEKPDTLDAKTDSPAPEATSSDAKPEESSTQDTEQPNKDVSAVTPATAPQRKPIVWKKKTEASPAATPDASPDTPLLTPQQPPATTRGRGRARRVRYSGASYGAGRGSDNWPAGTGRRGRPTRRRSMY